MAFTFRQLQYFVAMAQQGSVTPAAQNLSISQSSMTNAIKELEAVPRLEDTDQQTQKSGRVRAPVVQFRHLHP